MTNIKTIKFPTILLFGRTNVGKSTLFNRLREEQQALVSRAPGTTRDANRGIAEWQGRKFMLVDSGGIMDAGYLSGKNKTADNIDALVQKKARELLQRADLILFLVDARDGLLPADRELAKVINREKIAGKTVLVANKADRPRLRSEAADFNRLGLGEPLPVSAATGSGTGDLLDLAVSRLPEAEKTARPEAPGAEPVKIAIIGRPNTGKSSLVNRLLGEDRIIVSAEPHTTREPQDTELSYRGRNYCLVDTAGISRRGQQSARKAKYRDTLEKFSISKSLAVLKRAQVAWLVLDAGKEIVRQEAKLAEEIVKRQAGLVIVANKCDLLKLPEREKFREYLEWRLPFIPWAPVAFVSALTGEKAPKLLDMSAGINAARQTIIKDNALSKLLKRVIKRHAPAKGRNHKRPFIYHLTQVGSAPPVFEVKIGPKDSLQESYLNYIENQLREKFGFVGVPIKIYVKKG